MKNRSLSTRVLTVTTVASVATLLVVGLLLTLLVTRYPGWLLRYEVSGNIKQVRDGLRFGVDGKPSRVLVSQRLATVLEALPQHLMYRVLDAEGRVLIASDANAESLSPDGAAFDPELGRFNMNRQGEALHVATVKVDREGPPLYIQVARSERFERNLLGNDAEVARNAVLASAILALAIFSVALLTSFYRMLKPLRAASLAASEITPGNLTARLSTERLPTEFVPLVDAFNNALERLEQGYRAQQDFLASAAHELKTPLALMRGSLELDESIDRAAMLRDVDQMSHGVQQLLQLAELSEQQNYVLQPVDLIEAIDEVVTGLARLATGACVIVDIETIDRPERLLADRAALCILLRNLVENAIQHAPPGSRVVVTVNRASLAVRDHGRGLGPLELTLVFERFWRGRHRRDEGSGLGLSICSKIAQSHGWTLEARSASPGAEFVLGFGGPG